MLFQFVVLRADQTAPPNLCRFCCSTNLPLEVGVWNGSHEDADEPVGDREECGGDGGPDGDAEKVLVVVGGGQPDGAALCGALRRAVDAVVVPAAPVGVEHAQVMVVAVVVAVAVAVVQQVAPLLFADAGRNRTCRRVSTCVLALFCSCGASSVLVYLVDLES